MNLLMSWQPQSAYLAADVLSASPIRLIEILYDLTISTLENARDCCRAGDILGRGRYVNKAFEALVELTSSLDLEAGGSLAKNYSRLYDYCQRRLLQAHAEQSEQMIEEVQSLLGELREAWQSVMVKCAPHCATDEELLAEIQMVGDSPRYDCVG
jgi:flagellar secretion chaperone FliS